jgi:uncharacterized protein
MPKRSWLTRLLLLAATLAGFAAQAAAPPATPAPPAAPAQPSIQWQRQWDTSLFARAAREHRFVLLDLHAVWCHWCHVMDEETYADRSVIALIGARYLPVSIDADADPALSSRYGDWGWPATIVLAADGTEIVKRRGFIPAQQMASLLEAIIDDPTPGPSVRRPASTAATASTAPTSHAAAGARLDPAQLAAFRRTYDEAYDLRYGGWGSGQKFIDAPTLEYTFALIVDERDATAEHRARQTLDANLALIDPVWGGVYQYSATADWGSPHYEKLLAFQADDLRLYSEAYARWHDPRYLRAALALRRYVSAFLTSPAGAFYVSQDADLSAHLSGQDYYSRTEAARRRLGIPRVDTHEYARENGWAIRALCKLYDVTGDSSALADAQRAAEWVLAHRSLPHGGFRHDERDNGAPYLDDTLSMAQAFVALYRSTGERRWLTQARAAMDFIVTTFRDARGGFISAPAPAGATGVFADPPRTLEQNVAVARVANLLYCYTAAAHYRRAALHAMKQVAAAAVGSDELHPDVLVADRELAHAPIHITVVGGKRDPAARALHAAALRFPAPYLQVDWWDRAEGPLPNPEIRYPLLGRAAAFACTQNTCSIPVYESAGVYQTVTAALYQ